MSEKVRWSLKVGLWLGLIAGGVAVSMLVQQAWLTAGCSEIDAMGARGYTQGIALGVATWFMMRGLLPSPSSSTGGKNE